MTIKEKDRRKAFWISFAYVIVSPLMVHYGLDGETVKASAYSLTTLGIANYFSKPTGA